VVVHHSGPVIVISVGMPAANSPTQTLAGGRLWPGPVDATDIYHNASFRKSRRADCCSLPAHARTHSWLSFTVELSRPSSFEWPLRVASTIALDNNDYATTSQSVFEVHVHPRCASNVPLSSAPNRLYTWLHMRVYSKQACMSTIVRPQRSLHAHTPSMLAFTALRVSCLGSRRHCSYQEVPIVTGSMQQCCLACRARGYSESVSVSSRRLGCSLTPGSTPLYQLKLSTC